MESPGEDVALNDADADGRSQRSTPRLYKTDSRPEKLSCLKPEYILCISHFFSAWGNRMWSFAVGLYLVELTPNNLRLAGLYGLSNALTVVLFGPVVGNWVDTNTRLKVVRVTLILQNILVILCAGIILALLYVKPGDVVTLIVCKIAIIALGSLANLAGKGTTIAVERDWVVVIVGGDKEILAGTNAMLRRIDLSCAILAPVAVGIIMSLAHKFAGVIFICVWNLVSMVAEYYLLLSVYNVVPALAYKTFELVSESKDKKTSANNPETANEFVNILENEQTGVHTEDDSFVNEQPTVIMKAASRTTNLFRRLSSFVSGWKVYSKQTVASAGVSLAMLYLTVLGFSAITSGFAYMQRLSEAVVSGCYAAGSFMGIVGTFLFPRVRRKVGLPKTGLVSFFLQLSMLAMCVLSIWTPGSPSDLYKYHIHTGQKKASQKKFSDLDVQTTQLNTASVYQQNLPRTSVINYQHEAVPSISPNIQRDNQTGIVNSSSIIQPLPSITKYPRRILTIKSTDINSRPPTLSSGPMSRSTKKNKISPTPAYSQFPTSAFSASVNTSSIAMTKIQETFSYISIGLLMAGLILSRAGLWMTDLTVTQLVQENVAEKERGVVSGTQSAFNSILDLMHYVLAIILPKPNQFGILILISFSAVALGYISYIYFYFTMGRRLNVATRIGSIGSIDSVQKIEEPNTRNPPSSVPESRKLEADDEEEMIQGVLSVDVHRDEESEALLADN